MTPRRFFPVEEILVPEVDEPSTDGFTMIDQRLTRSLPHQIDLEGELNLVLTVPNGVATIWRDADPTTILSRSEREHQPVRGPVTNWAPTPEATGQLLVRQARRVFASLPLTAAARSVVGLFDRGNSGPLLEIIVLHWDLRTGSMRDNGDYGTRIRLAWRRIEQGVNHYSVPPVNPYSLARLKPQFRLRSVLGLKKPVKLARFSSRQHVLKVIR